MQKKILIVFGTRPEAIKMAPLVKEFQKNFDLFEVKVCVTAQHREMLDQVLEFFEIIPDYDLDIMRQGQDLYSTTSSVLLGMKSVLDDYEPDIVFVHGDTTTTFATSLAAFYQQIPIGHVEAGLRTGNIYSPWPEEANRQLTTQIATYHFAPTETNKNNLLRENVDKNSIVVTGNTVIDALFMALEIIRDDALLEKKIINTINKKINNSAFSIQHSKFILVTAHRRESHGEGIANICRALKTLAINNQDIHIVYPVHLHPSVQKTVKKILSGRENIHLIEPLEYGQFIYMMNSAYFIITDSGGIQEEAPFLDKPVLVTRDVTERQEALKSSAVKLVGTDTQLILKEANTLLHTSEVYNYMSSAHNPYGNGEACQKIVNYFKNNYYTKVDSL